LEQRTVRQPRGAAAGLLAQSGEPLPAVLGSQVTDANTGYRVAGNVVVDDALVAAGRRLGDVGKVIVEPTRAEIQQRGTPLGHPGMGQALTLDLVNPCQRFCAGVLDDPNLVALPIGMERPVDPATPTAIGEPSRVRH